LSTIVASRYSKNKATQQKIKSACGCYSMLQLAMSLQGQADAHVLRQRTGMKTIVGEKANIISRWYITTLTLTVTTVDYGASARVAGAEA